MKQRRAYRWMDWRRCYTGEVPSAIHTGKPSVRNMHHLRDWNTVPHIASYLGRFPASGENGDGDDSYYIFLPGPKRQDTTITTRPVGFQIACWSDATFGGDGAITWVPDYVGAPGTTKTVATGISEPTTTAAATDTQSHHVAFYYKDTAGVRLSYVPESSNAPGVAAPDGLKLARMRIQNLRVANLHMFHLPTDVLTNEQGQLTVGACEAGQIVKPAGSLGAVVHNVGLDGGHLRDTLESNSRRVLFQTPYPVGLWDETGSGTWVPAQSDSSGNAFLYRVRCRNLRGLGAGVNQICYPALVVTADAGVEIRFSSTTGADTWTYTVPAGGVSAQRVTASDGSTSGLDVDIDAIDTVGIDIKTGAGDTCLIHTVALFEGGVDEVQ